MAKVCEITGKKVISGNHVSHSLARVRRKFYPNFQKKRFYIAEEDRWVTLNVSAKGIRIINRVGILAAMKSARAKGFM